MVRQRDLANTNSVLQTPKILETFANINSGNHSNILFYYNNHIDMFKSLFKPITEDVGYS